MSIKKILTLAALPALFLASSCADMHDDLDECPYGLYVRFAYDYNTHRANLLHDHVGHLRLYIYDETATKWLSATSLIPTPTLPSPTTPSNSSSPTTNYPGHTYRLQAVALQKHWGDALATPAQNTASQKVPTPTLSPSLSTTTLPPPRWNADTTPWTTPNLSTLSGTLSK